MTKYDLIMAIIIFGSAFAGFFLGAVTCLLMIYFKAKNLTNTFKSFARRYVQEAMKEVVVMELPIEPDPNCDCPSCRSRRGEDGPDDGDDGPLVH